MSSVPAPFRDQYLAEVAIQRRRRFLVWCVTWIVIQLLLATLLALQWGAPAEHNAAQSIAHLMEAAVASAGLWILRGRTKLADDPERLAYWILIANAAVGSILLTVSRGSGIWFTGTAGSLILACLLLPITPRESLRLGMPLWLVWFAGQLLFRLTEMSLGQFAGDAMQLTFLAPSVIIAWIRTTRLGRRIESTVLREHFEEYHRSMFDARRLHEAIFPAARQAGPVRFAYRDRPRLGIGGDLLSAHDGPDGSLHLILLDVSGDGIGAALTVHRLHGEIERLFAENPTLDPVAAVCALDRYSYLTLMPHRIVAVMFALQLHRDGRLDYAGAGHTAAFIRRQGGGCERLESTTWALGASGKPCEDLVIGRTRLAPGDVLMAHSDGACHWTNRAGERLGYHGAESIIRSLKIDHPLDLPDRFMRQLDAFHGGPRKEDEDVLVVAVEYAPEPIGEARRRHGGNGRRTMRTRTARAVAVSGGAS